MKNIRETFKEQHPVHYEPQVVMEEDSNYYLSVNGDLQNANEWNSDDRYGRDLRTFPFANDLKEVKCICERSGLNKSDENLFENSA